MKYVIVHGAADDDSHTTHVTGPELLGQKIMEAGRD